MKKIILIVIVSLLILGCKVKRTVKNESIEVFKEEVREGKREEVKTAIFDSVKKEENQEKKEVIQEQKKEVEIKGKSEENKPLTYYNIVNGDTIDLFKVIGNADVIFKSSNNSQKSILNDTQTSNTTKETKIENIASKVVNKVTDTYNDVKTKSVNVVKKDFQFGTYLVFFFWGLGIIIVLALIYYFRKSTFFTNLFK